MSKSLLSNCCLRDTEPGTQVEFPLGGKTWGINYKVDVCVCCGKSCDTVEMYVCGVCGIVSETECKCEEVAV